MIGRTKWCLAPSSHLSGGEIALSRHQQTFKRWDNDWTTSLKGKMFFLYVKEWRMQIVFCWGFFPLLFFYDSTLCIWWHPQYRSLEKPWSRIILFFRIILTTFMKKKKFSYLLYQSLLSQRFQQSSLFTKLSSLISFFFYIKLIILFLSTVA